MWVFILDISGVLGQGLTQHSWPGNLFLMTTLFIGERTFSYRIRQGRMLQSSWTRTVPIWSRKCFCCRYCCYFGVPMKIPFGAKLIPWWGGDSFWKRSVICHLHFTTNEMTSVGPSQAWRTVPFRNTVAFCLWFSVWTFRWFCLFVFRILSFSDSFHDDFGEKISFCETCK